MFKLLNTPEAREAAAKWRKELSDKLEAKETAQRFMINYLREHDENLNDWERSFVSSVSGRIGIFALTDKQDEVLTKIFEKY